VSSDLTLQKNPGGAPPAADGLVWVYATNADGVSLNAGASAMNVGGSSLTVQGIADFNNDGTADTLMRNPADGYLYVFLNTGPAASSNVASLALVEAPFAVPVNPGF
jgi:hypothetical protein